MNGISQSREGAALRVYEGLRRFEPGSDEYETAEKALALVLNKKRRDDAFLLRNVLRDARRVRVRAAQRHPDFVPFDEELHTDHGDTPEDELAAGEMLTELAQAVTRDLPSDAIQCLPGLLREETVDESSRALGLPARRVKYLRRLIRAMAATLFEFDA